MSPSSLVFAAIIGVWALYLVPQWLRRRHELAEVREAESAGARVLEPRRREPRPTRESGQASPGPTLHRPVAPPVSSAPPVKSPRQVNSTRQPESASAAKSARPPTSVREVAARGAARRRARILMFLFAVTAVGWALVAANLIGGPIAVPATALLLLDLLGLRLAARRRQTHAAARRRPPVRRRTAPPPPVSSRPATVEVAEPVAEVPPQAPTASVGWTPVPVPLPLYTLKAAAPRWDLAPRERPVAIADPVPSVGEEDLAPLDLDAVLERRRAVNL